MCLSPTQAGGHSGAGPGGSSISSAHHMLSAPWMLEDWQSQDHFRNMLKLKSQGCSHNSRSRTPPLRGRRKRELLPGWWALPSRAWNHPEEGGLVRQAVNKGQSGSEDWNCRQPPGNSLTADDQTNQLQGAFFSWLTTPPRDRWQLYKRPFVPGGQEHRDVRSLSCRMARGCLLGAMGRPGWREVWGSVCCCSVRLCPTLCDPKDCSPPGSCVHGLIQARVLEWVAMLFSRGSSHRRDETQISCIGRQILLLSHLGSPWGRMDPSICMAESLCSAP